MSLPTPARSSARNAAGLSARLLLVSAFCVWAAGIFAPPLGAADRPMAVFGVGEGVVVRSLAIDERRNSLWVGTTVGVLEIDLTSHDVKNVFTRKDGLANEYVFAIGVAQSGDVWFGTNAGGASRFSDGEWETYFPMHGLADYWVYAFAFEPDGDIWIGTWDGVNFVDSDRDRFVTYRNELINIWVYGIDIDRAGRVWFGTEGGVTVLDGDTWRSWTHEDGLGAPNDQGLPTSENTGLGTRSRHDLNVLVESGESYNPSYVFAVKTDVLDRGVWFGTWGAGASLFDGQDSWRNFTTEDGLAGNIVYSIAQEPDGTLWFGTNHGVSRYAQDSWTTYRQGLNAAHVYAIALEGDGTLWLGTAGAVVRMAPVDEGDQP